MSKQEEKTCSVDDCEREYSALGFCNIHYRRFKKYGSPHKTTYARDGKSFHPLYFTYRNMIARCNNEKKKGYELYGGRGIKVCQRWSGVEGFTNFLKDMGEKPSPEYTLDRINNDGDYSPENCQWATPHLQAANRRNNGENIGVCRDAKGWKAYIKVGDIREQRFFTDKQDAISYRKDLEEKYLHVKT